MPPRSSVHTFTSISTRRPRSRTTNLVTSSVVAYRAQSTSEPRPSPPTTSNTAHTRPAYSRANLAAFAAEGELLTAASKGPPKHTLASNSASHPHPQPHPHPHPHPHSQSFPTPPRPSVYPRPVLKSNPYADRYTISEAELGEQVEPVQSISTSPVSAFASQKSHPRAPAESHPQSNTKSVIGERRGRTLRKGRHVQTQIQSHGRVQSAWRNPNPSSESEAGTKPNSTSTSTTTTTTTTASSPKIHLSIDEYITLHEGYITYTSSKSKIYNAVITWNRLKDACTCRQCRDPSTKQKLITTGQVMKGILSDGKPYFTKDRKEGENGKTGGGLKIIWKKSGKRSNSNVNMGSNLNSSITHHESELTTSIHGKSEEHVDNDIQNEVRHEEGANDLEAGVQVSANQDDNAIENPTFSNAHIQYIGRSKLRSMASPSSHHSNISSLSRTLWEEKDINDSESLKIDFEQLETKEPEIMLSLLEQLHVYGLVVIKNVPTNPTDDQSCYLRKVMSWIGEIRNTFYGETWDVKSMKKSKNVAYTNLDLGLHMDLLYFSSPPRFQSLHCLRNRVNGGMSYFVDSFKVASDLPRNIFSTLQDNHIPYVYNNDDHFLKFKHPIISRGSSTWDLHSAINWSPPFRDWIEPFSTNRGNPRSNNNPAVAAQQEQLLFEAIAVFEERLSDPKYHYSFTMKEGDLVMFDNRRVLHARTGFWDKTEEQRKEEGIKLIEGEPTRWLKGCYLDGEAVWDRLAVLKRQVDVDRKQDFRKLKDDAPVYTYPRTKDSSSDELD
ncbi:uncharacterized protein IL334_000230 [Kwoniella shivajii]|uniref:TauD/TfdA-like domain-containing protein n=1 Tax=Kwoniella shivajii TaxID=564305 RepID=A0ABZ1CNJ7_9TREE|nr:hypothetical protein IL334_000230 [Kwoniella shivajii]